MKYLKSIFAPILIAAILSLGLVPAEAERSYLTEYETVERPRALPACFDYLTLSQRAAQYKALSQMTSDEWAAYLAAVDQEPAVTADVQKVAAETGAALAGLEYRVKSPASAYEKMHSREEKLAISALRDLIRYTLIYEPDTLAAGTNAALAHLEDLGYTITRVHNTWDIEGTPYRGINTNLRTASGQIIEIQFHTQESYDFKTGENHRLYEARRALAPDSPEYQALEKSSITAAAKLKRPAHIETVRER